MNVNTFRLKK